MPNLTVSTAVDELMQSADNAAFIAQLGAGTTGAELFGAATAAEARGDIQATGSVTTGVTGADAISNIISLTAAEYAAIGTKDAATLYVIVG